MGVSKNRGTPKWMVKIMENPTNLGVPLFSETSVVVSYVFHILDLLETTINPKILTIFRLIIGRPWKPCRMMFESLRRIALMSCEKSRPCGAGTKFG